MAFVQLKSVNLSFGDRRILKDITLTLNEKSRMALSGANGSGKSTLMKIIAGMKKPDSGDVHFQKGCSVYYLPQSGINHEGHTLFEEVTTAFQRIEDLITQQEKIGEELKNDTGDEKKTNRLLEEHHTLQETIQNSGYYQKDETIGIILKGLGFKSEDFGKNTDKFSGGWQMRIALAKALLMMPDILLLDEPTNYLDIEARDWLEEFLQQYHGGIFIVSHDRYFLDRTVNEIAELFNGSIKKYKGNYTEYQVKREKELEALLVQYKKQQEEIAKAEDFIRRFRYNASKASMVQSKIKALDKVERIELPPGMHAIHFNFPPPPHSGKIALTLNGLSKSYGDKNVISNLDLEIEKGEKLVISGQNGAGKSTLLRIIAEKDAAYQGELKYGTGIKIGYFSQEVADSLDFSNNIIEEIESAAPTELIPKVRSLLGAFLFHGDDVFKDISVLSGGEKSRLALLKLLLKPCNLLILDEPTNHLDLNSKDILMEALTAFEGTLLFVSHDRYFIEGLATKVLDLGDSEGPKLYYGDYKYYLWKKEQEDCEGQSSDQPQNKAVSEGKLSHEEQKKRKNILQRLKKEEQELLQQLEALEIEKSWLNEELGKPEVYSNGEKAKKVQDAIAEKDEQEEELSNRWEEVAAQISELDG